MEFGPEQADWPNPSKERETLSSHMYLLVISSTQVRFGLVTIYAKVGMRLNGRNFGNG